MVLPVPAPSTRAVSDIMTAAIWNSNVRDGINFLTGTNGAPNISGTSTLALDATTIGTTNTLPFRIVGYAYGAGDNPGSNLPPVNINPWIRVKLNTSEQNVATGI